MDNVPKHSYRKITRWKMSIVPVCEMTRHKLLEKLIPPINDSNCFQAESQVSFQRSAESATLMRQSKSLQLKAQKPTEHEVLRSTSLLKLKGLGYLKSV
jgi:hypothetical protein